MTFDQISNIIQDLWRSLSQTDELPALKDRPGYCRWCGQSRQGLQPFTGYYGITYYAVAQPWCLRCRKIFQKLQAHYNQKTQELYLRTILEVNQQSEAGGKQKAVEDIGNLVALINAGNQPSEEKKKPN